MSTFTFTLTVSPQNFDRQSIEVEHIKKVIELAISEFGRGRGTVTSGSIVGSSPSGASNSSLGSWSYTPGATKP
jgi:hypothetical protein